MLSQLLSYYYEINNNTKDCIKPACVKCCNDPNCEPHREVRAELARKQSILDGTDYITRTANAKRASKVAPGSFYESNIS